MTSNRPYLVRALHEWIVDNGLTPHVLVNAQLPGVVVPQQYVHEGRIVLNIGPSAAHNLYLGNDEIRFHARFGGVSTEVSFPPRAVLAVYARENGEGMAFPDEPALPTPPDAPKPARDSDRRARLKIVK